jgi:hypothetical protein
MKVRQQPTMLRRPLAEVHNENPPVLFDHPSHLLDRLSAHGLPQMMQHDGAQHDIESRRLEGQRFGLRRAKIDAEARTTCLRERALDHLRRRVDAMDRPGVTHTTLCGDRQRARTAADIEHRLTWRDTREVEHAFTHRTLASECDQRDQHVVQRGATNNALTRLVRHGRNADGGSSADGRGREGPVDVGVPRPSQPSQRRPRCAAING